MSAVPANPAAVFGKAKYLVAASAVEYAVQLLVPVFLVRTLTHEEFASYRFMWLLAGTLTGSLLLGFPASLYYFLPREPRERQFGYVAQTAAFCALLAVLIGALLVGVRAAWPGLDFLRLLPRPLPVFLAFLVLIGATGLFDFLPAARADVKGQAGLNLMNALLRAGCTVTGAWFGSIESVCWALLAYAAARFMLMGGYVARSMPLAGGGFDALRFKGQFAYAVPFGVANACWSLRTQAQQWVGASILEPRQYALLSIAGTIAPIAMLVRQAITASIVAPINRLEAQRDVAGMVKINADANVLDTSYTYPVLTFFFVTSGPLFALVYTPAYAEAALATKWICVGMLALTVELTTLTNALRLRRMVLQWETAMLALSVALSVAGGLAFGFVGVVLGSVVSRYISTVYYVVALSRRTGVPLRRIQHWASLGRNLLCSVASGALGWLALGSLADRPLAVQLAVSGGVFGVAYLALALRLGVSLPGRQFFASLRRGRP
ncbi:MAG: lipopolysaccharide biosynthesis protein [Betaproteobacteria bacterium]